MKWVTIVSVHSHFLIFSLQSRNYGADCFEREAQGRGAGHKKMFYKAFLAMKKKMKSEKKNKKNVFFKIRRREQA